MQLKLTWNVNLSSFELIGTMIVISRKTIIVPNENKVQSLIWNFTLFLFRTSTCYSLWCSSVHVTVNPSLGSMCSRLFLLLYFPLFTIINMLVCWLCIHSKSMKKFKYFCAFSLCKTRVLELKVTLTSLTIDGSYIVMRRRK